MIFSLTIFHNFYGLNLRKYGKLKYQIERGKEFSSDTLI